MGSCRPRYRSGYRVVSLFAYADDIPGGAAESQYHQAASRVIPRTDMSDNGKRGEEGLGTGVVVKATPKTKTKVDVQGTDVE